MRILIVNGNTTEAITEACVTAARAAAAPTTIILGATPAFGPTVVSTRVENAIAAHAILSTLAEHAGRVDGVILAISHDTALEAARQLMPCPVLGMTEAACMTGCMLGGNFGVLTLGHVAAYEELVARHGLMARCADVRGVAATPLDALRDPEGVAAMVLAEALEMAAHCDSIVLGGAALAGMDRKLQADCPVPLLDGIACAVKLLEGLVAMGLPKPRAGSYAPPSNRGSTGLSPALAAMLKGG